MSYLPLTFIYVPRLFCFYEVFVVKILNSFLSPKEHSNRGDPAGDIGVEELLTSKKKQHIKFKDDKDINIKKEMICY